MQTNTHDSFSLTGQKWLLCLICKFLYKHLSLELNHKIFPEERTVLTGYQGRLLVNCWLPQITVCMGSNFILLWQISYFLQHLKTSENLKENTDPRHFFEDTPKSIKNQKWALLPMVGHLEVLNINLTQFVFLPWGCKKSKEKGEKNVLIHLLVSPQ